MKAISSLDIREWATDSNLSVGERGRISKDVKIAYLKAHPATARELAAAKGIQLPKRGRIAAKVFDSLV